MAQSPKKRMKIKKLGKTRKNQVKEQKRIQENIIIISKLENEL